MINPSRMTRRGLLGVAAGVSLGALAGCSDKPGTGVEQPSGVSTGPVVEFGEATTGVQYSDPYVGPRATKLTPFGDPSKTFRVVVPQDTTSVGDWNTNKYSKWLEEKTGVKINYEAVLVTNPDGSADLSKINAMIASGDLPDAFLAVGLTRDQIALYGGNGLFVPLNAFIEHSAPHMRQMMTDLPDVRTTNLAQDGNIYNFGGVNDCFHCRSAGARAFINQKYLDAVGLEMPKTTDDFRALLKAMKDKNPSGKEGFLPFIGGDVTYDTVDPFMMGPFTYNPGAIAGAAYLRLNAGQVEFAANTEGWRNGLRFMRQLFDDGTLTKQTFTVKGEELTKLGNNGLIGVCRAFNWAAFIEMAPGKDAPWRDYVAMPPLAGPDGTQIATWTYGTTPFTNSMAITSACKDPEALVRWADAQMELESTLRAYAGPLDEGWKWAKAGEKGSQGKQAVWGGIPRDEVPVGEGWSQRSVMYRSADFRAGEITDPSVPNLDQIGKLYEPFAQPEDQFLPPLLYSAEVIAERGDVEAGLTPEVSISMAKFATGELDVDNEADWKAYTDKLNAIGLPKYLELTQKAYDSRPK